MAPKSLLRDCYQSLAVLDSMEGDYLSAYRHYKLFISYRDSLINKQSAEKIMGSQMQYEFEKKEAATKAAQDKKDAETKRTRNLQFFVLILFLLLSGFLIIYSRQKQKGKKKIETAYANLKSTQAQLIQSEKMASLGQLTAGIAHEIQNPLNFVNNFSEVNKELLVELKDEADKGNMDEVKAIANDVIENSEKINHHGKRADAIVKRMLQHSQSGSRVKEPADINALADEYLRLAYHGLRAKDKSFNVTMKTDFDSTIGKINIIPQDAGRVLLNLYNNAFYAMNEKKKHSGDDYLPILSVKTKKVNDHVEISVVDNGNGIPQNIVDKIFQPFFTSKPTGQGTGLGLSLSYDIVKAHGGEIKVETKEGEFTEFVIQLPIPV
ncbi:MAG: ATP-binding protein [Bacteroidota bacterium]